MANLTRAQMAAMYSNPKNKELVHAMEGLSRHLAAYADITHNPSAIYNSDLTPMITSYVTEGLREQISASLDLGDNAVVYMESLTDQENEAATPMETVDAHMHNITQLLENSIA